MTDEEIANLPPLMDSTTAARLLGVTRQVMSNHLACLRGCGLVEAARDGRHAWYRLADPHLAPALDELLRVVLVVDPGCCAGKECSCSRS